MKIATIFSYAANEDDAGATGINYDLGLDNYDFNVVAEQNVGYVVNQHSREKLDEYIGHYNQLFGTKYSTKDSESFYNYYNDISKRVKDRQIDILLVVNMFLTGFDSKQLNTLYVDKNLKYHGLIQAYSRTNRILNEQKSQGNIVVFRNLKKATDDAITLFSNKDAIDVIIMKPYEDYVKKFNDGVQELLKVTPTVNSVNDLADENQRFEFVKAFRELIRLKNIMAAFADFNWDSLNIEEQTFEDYKSKYLDLYDATKKETEKVSILQDVDFELELIHRDEINVAYILQLLVKLKSKDPAEKKQFENEVINLLGSEVTLRSKRELIEKFIQENLPAIDDSSDIPDAFDKFWTIEQQKAFDTIIKEESLNTNKTEKLIESYLFAERKPLRDEVLALIEGAKPTLLERKKTGDRILAKIVGFVETFINGLTG